MDEETKKEYDELVAEMKASNSEFMAEMGKLLTLMEDHNHLLEVASEMTKKHEAQNKKTLEFAERGRKILERKK